MSIYQQIKNFIIPKLKFAATSLVATLLDYILYLILVTWVLMTSTISNIISASCGMLINFLLQKKYVFMLKRNLYLTFTMSIAFSFIGIGLGTTIIYYLTQVKFFAENQPITKLIVTGVIFFYNFYTKRFAFEKKVT